MGLTYSLRAVTISFVVGSATSLCVAEEVATPKAVPAAKAASDAAPANSDALQAEYARLAQLLNSDDTWGKKEAATTLLVVRPQDVADPAVRKLIARGYRSLATDSTWGPSKESVRGLVIWGGKYSVPILVDLLDNSRGVTISPELLDGLASLKDPKGAEAVAKKLGNHFNHEAAVSALRKMGSAAEGALIAAAPSNDAKVSLAAVQLLGDVGGEKSLPLLEKASSSRNAEVKQAARDSIKKIRQRQKTGKGVDEDAVDSNSPFAPATGPPVDILALKAKATAAPAAQSSGGRKEIKIADADKGDWSDVKLLKIEKAKDAKSAPDAAWASARERFAAARAGRGRGRSAPAEIAHDETLQADPALDEADVLWKPQVVPISIGGDSSATTAVDVAMTSNPTAVVIQHAASSDTGRLERLDLRAGKSLGVVPVPAGESLQCYLSPGGAKVLIVSQLNDTFATVRLNVWNLSNDKPIDAATWYPYAGKFSVENTIKWVHWTDDKNFLTLNDRGQLVLWQVGGRKAIYRIDTSGWNFSAAVSPGGKYLAFTAWAGLGVLRTRDGAVMAMLSDRPASALAMAFRSDGKQMATVSDKEASANTNAQGMAQLSIYDIPSGKLAAQSPCSSGGALDWLDADTLLLANSIVTKLGMLQPAWRYESAGEAFKQVGPWRWTVAGGKLVPMKLPHEAALAAISNAKPDDVYFVLQPGTKVSLEVKMSQEGDEIGGLVRNAIRQHGLVVADGEPLRFIVEDKTGQSAQKTYRHVGIAGKTEDQTVSYTPRSLSVRLENDGVVLWRWSSYMAPPEQLKVGLTESAQDTVNRLMSEKWSQHFTNFDIAEKMIDPRKIKPLGSSKLTANGIE